jgi:asparagine synthetase B (glutamine-hydrolysing)
MMYPALLAENLREFQFRELRRNMRGIHDVLDLPYGKILWDTFHEIGGGMLPRGLMPSIRRAHTILSPGFLQEGMRASVVLRRLARMREWRRQVGGTLFDQKLLLATLQDSLPGILRQVDRNSMAFSIEARLPFLDYRLVEFTFSLPSRQKLDQGVSKQVYRRALSGLIPDAIRDRRSKLGFVTAEADWVRERASSAFLDAFAGIPPDAPYDGAHLRAILARFLEGRSAYDPLLWQVFSLEHMRAREAFLLPEADGISVGAASAAIRNRG